MRRKVAFMFTAGLLVLSQPSAVLGQYSAGEPLAAITSLSPAQKAAGSAQFTLTVNGKNFKTTDKVLWGDLPAPQATRPTTFVSSTKLTAVISAQDVAAARSSFVRVLQDPRRSNPFRFIVSFIDVAPGAPFYHSINTILYQEITAGCSTTNYCPVDLLTRQQMAVLLLKAEHEVGYLPPPCGSTHVFADVPCPPTPGAPFGDWIGQLFVEGVTAGCGGNNFCPTAPTRRDQMAVFVLKARLTSSYQPPAAVGLFSDVPAGNAFAPWVEDEYNRGNMSACATGPLRFCPDTSVQRGPMADFIGKAWAFGLQATLYGDEPNFHIGGAYLGSVAKVPDVFTIFATAAPDRYKYDAAANTWVDEISSCCPANPQVWCSPPPPNDPCIVGPPFDPNYRAKCGDAQFLFWKHVSCHSDPCASNDRYNVFEGTNNYRCDPDPDNWPPPGMQRVLSAKIVTCGLPSKADGTNPDTGLPCRPQNPGTYPGSMTAPKVVYVPSTGKYLMAFNANINFQGGADNWRMLWSYSDDGASWQIPTDYLFRSSRELTECESGMEVQDINYDGNYVYVLIGAVNSLYSPSPGEPQGNKYYLLRATLTANPPYYGQWQLASGVATTTGLFTWFNITPGGDGNLINLAANGYELFDKQFNYPPEAAFARVPVTVGGKSRWVFTVRRPYDSGINIYSTDSLTRPPVRALVAVDTTGLSPNQYGWYMSFTKAGKLLSPLDGDLANPIVFWVVAYTRSTHGTGDNRLDYRKVRMSLCGAPPFGPCP